MIGRPMRWVNAVDEHFRNISCFVALTGAFELAHFECVVETCEFASQASTIHDHRGGLLSSCVGGLR